MRKWLVSAVLVAMLGCASTPSTSVDTKGGAATISQQTFRIDLFGAPDNSGIRPHWTGILNPSDMVHPTERDQPVGKSSVPAGSSGTHGSGNSAPVPEVKKHSFWWDWPASGFWF